MTVLSSVIRMKQLAIGLHEQQLGLLRRQRQAWDRRLHTDRADLKRATALLWDQLATGRELHLHRLQGTRGQIDLASQRCADAEIRLHECDGAIEVLERTVRMALKEIEKLESLREENRAAEKMQEQQRQWLLLDEWVVNRRGERA